MSPIGRGTDPLDALPLGHAVLLGLLHGPAELLPISSSGHITLVPWLAGWPYGELDPELRKAFEVALHAGTAAALLIALRDEVGDAARGLDRRRITLIVVSFAVPAVAGLTLERAIEQRLGTPSSIAGGLLAGSAAMAWADRRGAGRLVRGAAGRAGAALTGRAEGAFGGPGAAGGAGSRAGDALRTREEAGAVDALWLGVAQACALIPGASRNGMTLAAARARGFGREDANALSRHVALPVIVGATALKGTRLARRGLPRGLAGRFAAGVLASFLSTLGSTWLIRQVERDRSLLPYALYRTALALAVLRRAARSPRPPQR